MTLEQKLNALTLLILGIGAISAFILAMTSSEARKHWLRFLGAALCFLICVLGYCQYKLTEKINESNISKEQQEKKEKAEIKAALDSCSYKNNQTQKVVQDYQHTNDSLVTASIIMRESAEKPFLDIANNGNQNPLIENDGDHYIYKIAIENKTQSLATNIFYRTLMVKERSGIFEFLSGTKWHKGVGLTLYSNATGNRELQPTLLLSELAMPRGGEKNYIITEVNYTNIYDQRQNTCRFIYEVKNQDQKHVLSDVDFDNFDKLEKFLLKKQLSTI